MTEQNKSPVTGKSIQDHGPGLKVRWHVDALIEGHIYYGFIKYLSLYGTEIFLDLNLSLSEIEAAQAAVLSQVDLLHREFGRVESRWKHDGTRVTAIVKASWMALFSSVAPARPAALPVSDPRKRSRSRGRWVLAARRSTSGSKVDRQSARTVMPSSPVMRCISAKRAWSTSGGASTGIGPRWR